MGPNKKLSLEKAVHCISIALVSAALSTVVYAGKAHAESADKTEKKIAAAAESFKRDYPNAGFSKAEGSGIEGLYEITTGVNIVFYSPASGKIIFGEMYDKSGRNITAEKRRALVAQYEAETAKMIDGLPLDRAIKIGNGKNIVIEFADIDCPFCRKLEEFFKNRDDITRYVFLVPLEQIHPKSMGKTREVLCSKDPAREYETAMDGGLDKADPKGCGDKEKDTDSIIAEYRISADKMGVDGTPALWVNKKHVNGADIQKIERYLASESGNK